MATPLTNHPPALPSSGEIVCVSDCGDQIWTVNNLPIVFGLPLSILLVGGLLMRRWRDLFLVAFVGFSAMVLVDFLRQWEFAQRLSLEPLTRDGFWPPTLVYIGCLAVAGAAHGLKRLMGWFARSRHQV